MPCRNSRVFTKPFPGSGICADGAAIASTCSNNADSIISIPNEASNYRVHNAADSAPQKNIGRWIDGRRQLITHVETQHPGPLVGLIMYWCIDGLFFQQIKFALKKTTISRNGK